MEGSSQRKAGRRSFRLLVGAFGILACPALCLQGQVEVTGTVTDRNGSPVAEARVAIERPGSPGSKTETESNDQGEFGFNLVESGRYLLRAAHADFFPIEGQAG